MLATGGIDTDPARVLRPVALQPHETCDPPGVFDSFGVNAPDRLKASHLHGQKAGFPKTQTEVARRRRENSNADLVSKIIGSAPHRNRH